MSEWIPIGEDGVEWLPVENDGSEWGTIIVGPSGEIIFYAFSQVTKLFDDDSQIIDDVEDTSDLIISAQVSSGTTRIFEEVSALSLEDI